MKENLLIFTMILMLFQKLFALKFNQVPKAKDLSNHFGSDPKKDLYGPLHKFNTNSFLYNDQSIFANFNPGNHLIITSGKMSQISKEAESIISPLLPVKMN